jgi:hypothetical protein
MPDHEVSNPGPGKMVPDNLKQAGHLFNVEPEASARDQYLRLVDRAEVQYSLDVQGLIRMWGDLLYQVYHRLPEGSASREDASRFFKLCMEYERKSSQREDIMDWITDGDGCPEKGGLTCSRKVVRDALDYAAGLVKTREPMLVRRTGREVPGDYASYTIVEGGYETNVGGGDVRVQNAYLLPPGYPVIVGHGFADDWELILKLEPGKVKKVGRERTAKTAATISDIESKTAEDVRNRARGVKVRLSRADPKRGIWTFSASGSEGRSYTIRVQANLAGKTKDVGKLPVRVSCDCDFFRWQGPEHYARSNGYLYGKPRGTASAPTEKDPRGKHWACKHLVAALTLARNYRVASASMWPEDAELVPDFGPLAARVADRYGGGD